MSASTEKKLRQAAREAGTDKKILARIEEEKKKATSKRRWTLGTIGVVVLIALIIFLDSGVMYKSTAYSVGDRDYSASEVGYFYANQYYSFVNQYGSYASMFGIDTSTGYKGLDKQPSVFGEGSWKDYFLDAAKTEMLRTKAAVDYAKAEGIELSAEDLESIELNFEDTDEYARSMGYGSADKMLSANYGAGVNEKLLRTLLTESMLATKAAEQKSESFQYGDAQLEEKYASYEGGQDIFDYAYYYVAAETEEVAAEDGSTKQEVSPEALKAAEKTAEDIKKSFESGKEADFSDRLNAAVAANVADATAQSSSNPGSALSIAVDWLKDGARKAGDICVETNGGETGCNVVVFLGRDDNHYNTVSVRHILVKAEASEDGTYSDEAKAAAKAKAEDILKEFNAGDKSEDSFAALANQYSEDGGSNTNGGLYENIAKGQMVENFENFCFEGHKSGDTGIVYGESGSYAGYHVMFFVSEGQLYSSVIAENELRSADAEAWMQELEAAYTQVEGSGMRFVG